MFTRVMEDGLRGSRRMCPCRLSRPAVFALAALGAVVVPMQEAAGQADPAHTEFRASVLDLSSRVQRVTVPIHRSVTIETTVGITRADIIAQHIADIQVVSPTRLLVTGQSFGTTSVVLMGADNRPYVIEVTVELDLETFNQALRSIDPLSDAKGASVMGHIVLTGTVSSGERATRMVELAGLFVPAPGQGQPSITIQNHLRVAGEQQVLLRCVVAEVSRTASRELGVNGFLAGENFRDAFLVNQLGGINPINMGAAGDALVTRNIPFLTDENGIPISQSTTLSLGFPRAQMQLFLRAMANNNLLKVLAEPNLVAVSGETATFLAGGEFPIPVPQGNQQVTIQFREFGIRLNFTPVVQGHQNIRLRVAPEVSELDFTTAVQIEGFVVPGLTSRSAETTVELGSGQTIAIAGLLSENVRGLASRIPGLGDVPVLGALFRSVNFQRSMTELVILVTPELVSPLDAHQKVRLPGEGMESPGDFELYALGLLESKESRTKAPCGSDELASDPDELSVHGPWGHAGNGDLN